MAVRESCCCGHEKVCKIPVCPNGSRCEYFTPRAVSEERSRQWKDARREHPYSDYVVLAYCDGRGSSDFHTLCRYSAGQWIDKYDTCVLDVIAWRPLPDPPAFD